MSHSPFLSILLPVALVAQSVIAGWGHSHAHVADGGHSHVVVGGQVHLYHSHARHVHDHDHDHFHDSHEPLPLPNRPAEKDDCSVCRHLALAAILTIDLEALAVGDSAESVQAGESSFASTIAIGLRRPRSPPELS